MRFRDAALAISGLAGISLAALMAGQQFAPKPSTVRQAASLDETSAVSSSTEEPASSEKRGALKSVRPIAPEIVAEPPVEFETLERVEARNPLSDVALAKPPPIPERIRLFRPVATSAGRLEAADYKIALSGIAAVEPEEMCTREDGTKWPCGMLARTALRNFLRGRSIECRTPAGPLKGTIATDCLLGKQDVGKWLVTNGWARAVAGGPYAEAEKTAKSQRLGIHGPGPAIEQ